MAPCIPSVDASAGGRPQHGVLEVGDGQRLAWRCVGNRAGIPALVVHGGPGSDASTWGVHSLRRGFAAEAIARGVPERDVQRHGRWRSRAAMEPYIEAARTFDPTNPTHWLT